MRTERLGMAESGTPGVRPSGDRPSPLGPQSLQALHTRRVLVVDHDRDVAEVIATLFEMWGAEVTIAQSVREVRERLTESPFDLITVEIAMPGESGADLWRYLSAEHPRLAGRLLFITGDRSAATQRFIESTGQPLLMKPCMSKDLRQVAVRTLEQEAGAAHAVFWLGQHGGALTSALIFLLALLGTIAFLPAVLGVPR